jgi:hypothetical protein
VIEGTGIVAKSPREEEMKRAEEVLGVYGLTWIMHPFHTLFFFLRNLPQLCRAQKEKKRDAVAVL